MDKQTIQHIIDMFAEQCGITKKSAEAIVRTFFDVLVEGLRTEGTVKINHLGTFKVINVAERESVNVNNGERIVIEGYRKVTFAPAESVNISEAEIAEVSATDVTKETASRSGQKVAEDSEIKVELAQPEITEADLQQDEFSTIDSIIATPESLEEVRRLHEAAKQRAAEAIEAANAALVESVRLEKMLEEMEMVEMPSESQPMEETAQAAEDLVQTDEEEQLQPEAIAVESPKSITQKKRNTLPWIIFGIIVLVFAIAAILFYTNIQTEVSKQEESVTNTRVKKTSSKASAAKKPAIVAPIPQASTVEEKQDTVQRPTTYVLKRGDYLAKISREIYGTADSVPSIIRLNRFSDPDNIPIGTEIKLP